MMSEIPDKLEMLEAFWVEPREANPEDGFWYYRFDDGQRILDLSFNVFEAWIITTLYQGDDELVQVTIEGAKYLRVRDTVDGPALYGYFRHGGYETRLKILARPHIKVEWSTLDVYVA